MELGGCVAIRRDESSTWEDGAGVGCFKPRGTKGRRRFDGRGRWASRVTEAPRRFAALAGTKKRRGLETTGD